MTIVYAWGVYVLCGASDNDWIRENTPHIEVQVEGGLDERHPSGG